MLDTKIVGDKRTRSSRTCTAQGRNAQLRRVDWSLPAELVEIKLGPPISPDDLLSFHLSLAGDEWQDELAAMPRP